MRHELQPVAETEPLHPVAAEQLSPGQLPRFDLVLLGPGDDRHTASLFSGTMAVHENQRLVAANWVRKLHARRIALTAPVSNNAACVIFLVAGADKAITLRAVLEACMNGNAYRLNGYGLETASLCGSSIERRLAC
jgi:6-phosphogluconolactonase